MSTTTRKLAMALGPLVATTALTMFGYTPNASACGSAIADDIDEERQEANLAQNALDDGDYRKARYHAKNVAGDRGRRINALSFVRDRSATEDNLERAELALRQIHENRGDADVVSQVDLGEAVARLPGHQAQARALLEPLAKQDLIGSPHAYAALVRVGSTIPIRLTALRRCRETADPGDKMMCVTGFTPETNLSRAYYSSGRNQSADRWIPRAFVGITAIGLGALVFAGVRCARRVRRRSREMRVA